MTGSINLPSRAIVLRLDVSVWTGKTALTRADFPADAQLPPEDLANLGTKRLVDPATLRPFGKAKTQAIRLLERYAVRFLGGWLMDEQYMSEVEAGLNVIRDEFRTAEAVFLNEYDSNVTSWINEHPSWGDIIHRAVAPVSTVETKFNFSWQSFYITPYDSGDENSGNDIETCIKSVASEVVKDLAADVAELNASVFTDRSKGLTPKSVAPLLALAEKCRRMALFNPEALMVAEILTQLYHLDLKDKATAMIIHNVLSNMSKPDELQAMAEDWRGSANPFAFLDRYNPQYVGSPYYDPALDVMPAAPAEEPVPAAPAPIAAPAPAAPAAPAAPVQSADNTTTSQLSSLASLLDGLF